MDTKSPRPFCHKRTGAKKSRVTTFLHRQLTLPASASTAFPRYLKRFNVHQSAAAYSFLFGAELREVFTTAVFHAPLICRLLSVWSLLATCSLHSFSFLWSSIQNPVSFCQGYFYNSHWQSVTFAASYACFQRLPPAAVPVSLPFSTDILHCL